ncbi:MAG: peptidyl-prolyl cis-trans isomerase [Solirubrobacteraceae bacterium]
MKTRKSIPALGAFFVLVAVALSACGSGVPGNSVADVAGNPISLKAFNHWMYVDAKGEAQQSPGAPVIVPNDPPGFSGCISQARAKIPTLKKTPVATLKTDCKQLFTSLSGQVMDFLIKAYWYQAQAHKIGISLTDAQAQKALATAKKGQFPTDAQFQAFLKQSGQTQADILYRVRVNQVFMKLTAKHPTTVTPAAIAAYYAAHKTQFGTPETRDLRIVLAKSAAAAQTAKTALQHGQSWTTVAKKYSTDVTTKNKGGVLTNVTAGQQDAALSQAAFAAPVNKLRGPVKGQFGYYVLEVTKVTPSTQKSLAASTSMIKQTLTGQLQTAAQTAVDAAAKKAWLSKTTCRSLYAMADCKGYKAPKTTSTAAPGGSTPTPPSGATSPTPTPTPSTAAPTPTTGTPTQAPSSSATTTTTSSK